MSEVPRIEINVPLGTKLQEVIDEVLKQATAKSKSQFAAAIGLGIRPETLSRRLKKIRLARSENANLAGAGHGESPPSSPGGEDLHEQDSGVRSQDWGRSLMADD